MPKPGSGEINGSTTKKPITVACCMPRQEVTIEAKLQWLEETLDQTSCDIFLLPQEMIGGHYVWQLARKTEQEMPLHVDQTWLEDTIGEIARRRKVCIGVGACTKSSTRGAMEGYYYFSSQGKLLGEHYKYALPRYDDMRAEGHGQLWPETNYNRRATPVDIPELRLRVGTVFCWEVFSQSLWGSYSLAGVNLVTHPIKFAPRGWLQNKKQGDGKMHIVGFGNAPKSQMWVDRLIMAGRHQVMCPIAVSCNSWNLGEKFMALTGVIDEVKKDKEGNPSTELFDVPSTEDNEKVHTFQMLPELYSGLDHHHSAGAFVAHTGSIDGYSEMGELTMHGKIRRLEAHLIGGTTKMDCQLKAQALARQKFSTTKRALGVGIQRLKRKPK